jgi:hypothetical protein
MMNKAVYGVALLAVLAMPAAAQFPRLAPPPPCRAKIGASPILAHWTSAAATRGNRPKVAIFSLQPDIDDAGKVYLAVALPDRIRQRLSLEPRLRIATEEAFHGP